MTMTKNDLSFVSEKASKIEASVTLSVTALATQLKKEGKAVIGMSAGEPDFDTPNNIKDAAKKALDKGFTKYTPSAGIIELREAISQKLKKDNNLSYSPDEIVVSCGAKHTIFNILAATLNPGDDVLIPTPYWVSYPHQVKLNGGNPIFIPTDETTNFKINAKNLSEAITPKTKILILNSPSNPTGMVYTREELEEIAPIIEKHKLLVISDEIYEHLLYKGKHISIASISNALKSQTLVVNGVSKAYSMTGWRIGYCAGPIEIIKAINKIQSHSTSNPTSLSQWASLEAISGPQEEVESMRQSFDNRRKIMTEELNKISGINCLTPEGAFYAFPNISKLFGKKTQKGKIITNSVTACEDLLQEKLVACVPGSGFGAEGYIRLSYATSENSIRNALKRIADWANSLT